MKTKKYLFLLMLCIISIIMSEGLFAYDDKLTHRKITEKAVGNTQAEDYFIHNLGFNSGLITEFPINSGNSIIYLLMEGSKLEDDPLCRATNHFHNPLRSWDRAGISTISWPLCYSWDITSFSTRLSALTWATGYDKYSGPVISSRYQQMGWENARNYFYSALTSIGNATREDYFAKTFQSVGQVMHLLQDMAVPAHVRNDFWNSHVWTGGANPYELYVSNHSDKIASLTKEQIAAAIPAFSSPRQTDFWDTSDGSIVVPVQIHDRTLQSKAGLAEYTNANFVSEGTLFSDSSTSSEFEYPKKSATIVDHTITDPFNTRATVKRPYYYKAQDSDDWETGYRLAGVNYTYFYDSDIGSTAPDKIIPPLDDYVHRDYAEKLLPRAVGYSAALLNYFFRGTLEIDMPDIQIYGITDGSQAPYLDAYGNRHQQFTTVRAKVRNTTINEAIGIGTLQAVARYKVVPNYAPDLSNYPPSGQTMLSEPYSYSVSSTVDVASISSTSFADYTFNFDQSPIPAGITDLTLQVVFKGTIGNEVDNAIAVGMRDISEPTHLVFWNLSDRFSYGTACVDQPGYLCYKLVSAEDIEKDAVLMNFLTQQGYNYAPTTQTFSFAFKTSMPTTILPPVAQAIVQGGQHARIIALVDGQGTSGNFVQLQWQEDYFSEFFYGAVSLIGPDGSLQSTPTTTFRYHDSVAAPVPFTQHFDTGIVQCYPELPGGGCPYPESDAPPADPTPVSLQILIP